jgi:hypothetical protein
LIGRKRRKGLQGRNLSVSGEARRETQGDAIQTKDEKRFAAEGSNLCGKATNW